MYSQKHFIQKLFHELCIDIFKWENKDKTQHKTQNNTKHNKTHKKHNTTKHKKKHNTKKTTKHHNKTKAQHNKTHTKIKAKQKKTFIQIAYNRKSMYLVKMYKIKTKKLHTYFIYACNFLVLISYILTKWTDLWSINLAIVYLKTHSVY